MFTKMMLFKLYFIWETINKAYVELLQANPMMSTVKSIVLHVSTKLFFLSTKLFFCIY